MRNISAIIMLSAMPMIAQAGEWHPVAYIAYDRGGETLTAVDVVSVSGRAALGLTADVKCGSGVTTRLGCLHARYSAHSRHRWYSL